jgi:hypothetical protein
MKFGIKVYAIKFNFNNIISSRDLPKSIIIEDSSETSFNHPFYLFNIKYKKIKITSRILLCTDYITRESTKKIIQKIRQLLSKNDNSKCDIKLIKKIKYPIEKSTDNYDNINFVKYSELPSTIIHTNPYTYNKLIHPDINKELLFCCHCGLVLNFISYYKSELGSTCVFCAKNIDDSNFNKMEINKELNLLNKELKEKILDIQLARKLIQEKI